MNVSVKKHPITVSVARDFSETPGPRSRDEGDFSGEQFLEQILLPRYQEASSNHGELVVDLDGTEGYATSFLEATFGELARRFDPNDVLKVLRFKSDDEPFLIDEITKYIKEARNT